MRRGDEGNGIGFSLFMRTFSYMNKFFGLGHLPGKLALISQLFASIGAYIFQFHFVMHLGISKTNHKFHFGLEILINHKHEKKA